MESCARRGVGERLRKDLERLAGYRVIDDTFMRAVMKDNRELAQRALRTMTGIGDLELVSEETQRDLKRVVGSRSTVLDVYCTDGAGNQYDMEVQGGDDLDPLRFRYYGSSMDVDFLERGHGYGELPERWVVVVLEEDPDGPKRATRVYEYVERGSGEHYGDGTRFLYVNASYRGDDDLGRLL